MLNIQDYQRYSGEKKIALMDNSTVSFLEQVERAGISTKELLKDYDAILIPNWVSEEICDSIYRKDYTRFLLALLPCIIRLFSCKVENALETELYDKLRFCATIGIFVTGKAFMYSYTFQKVLVCGIAFLNLSSSSFIASSYFLSSSALFRAASLMICMKNLIQRT